MIALQSMKFEMEQARWRLEREESQERLRLEREEARVERHRLLFFISNIILGFIYFSLQFCHTSDYTLSRTDSRRGMTRRALARLLPTKRRATTDARKCHSSREMVRAPLLCYQDHVTGH